jgi:hypothetical protein
VNARDELIYILSESLTDRGVWIPEWPQDEQDLYHSFNKYSDQAKAERAEAVRALRFQKAADAILAAGCSTSAAAELAELRAIVEKHINMRSEYVTALKNSTGDNDDNADYWRWTGGAEARRQLAEDLGWTVPYKPGDRTAPKEARDA